MVPVVRTDNVPPFKSYAFKQFAERAGFVQCKVTPLHPMGNAIVEQLMQPVYKKC